MADRFLSVEDRQQLAIVIGNAYDFQLGPAARLQFLATAGLSRFVPSIDLAASPRVLSGVLINLLEPFGMLPERPTYHALGSLITAVMADPGTPPDEARLMAEMLVKYQLVADQDYLNKLRDDYHLEVDPVRQADPDTAAPPSNPDPAAEPAFDAEASDLDALEQIVNSEDNFIDIDRMAGAIYAAQAVGRVELPMGRARGTGFLVGPDLLLTNQHVLTSKQQAEAAVVRFDYHSDAAGVTTKGRVYEITDSLYLSSPSTELDYALVRLDGVPLEEKQPQPEDTDLTYLEMLRQGLHRGYLLLSPSMIVREQRVNIIQHPNGNPQKVVLTQNYVISDMSDERVHYLADTMPGSSGSPVLNQQWDVVALHHSGGAHPPQKLTTGLRKALKGHYKFNEGIPMRAIIPQIERYLPRS